MQDGHVADTCICKREAKNAFAVCTVTVFYWLGGARFNCSIEIKKYHNLQPSDVELF